MTTKTSKTIHEYNTAIVKEIFPQLQSHEIDDYIKFIDREQRYHETHDDLKYHDYDYRSDYSGY